MNNAANHLTALITEKFIASCPQEAAKVLEGLATHEIMQLLGPLKAEAVVACLNRMQTPKAAAVLRRLPMRQASYALSRLEPVKAARIMREFSGPYREKMRTTLKPRFIKLLEEALLYPAGSAGAAMSIQFTSFRTDAKLTEVIDKLKILPRKKLPAACLVITKDGQLKGVFRTAEIAFYAATSTAGSIMTELPAVPPSLPAAEALELIREKELPLLPVIAEDGVVIGVIYPQTGSASSAKKSRFHFFK